METIKIRDLKKGEFFTLKAIEEPTEAQVYVRGDYDRSSRKYSCTKFSDTCSERFLPGDKKVFVGFYF